MPPAKRPSKKKPLKPVLQQTHQPGTPFPKMVLAAMPYKSLEGKIGLEPLVIENASSEPVTKKRKW